KIKSIKNKYIYDFIARFIKLFNPDSVFVCDDSEKDFNYIREKALKDGEEIRLAKPGHTLHFDGIYDQGRDTEVTKFLVPKGMEFGKRLNTIDKDEGIAELMGKMSGIMKGREMLVVFFTLGPSSSPFTIPAVQITDSSYVAHSETILYRPGYEEFKKLKDYNSFFSFVHSEGELENAVSKNFDKKRIYIDTGENIVYSVNTQYGGNTIGLKKLAMRLAINRASQEDWLTEHMFVSGIHGPGKRVSYFAGAFPSMCGKTSTAMLRGETIIGDDIVYIRSIEGKARAVNVEKGIFGIIQDINPDDDPTIWEIIEDGKEVIFSNVLMTEEKQVYWIGHPGKPPSRGINYAGDWFPGKLDRDGKPATPSHKNARFTVSLEEMKNLDRGFYDVKGVELEAIIYGGRDSDTWVPVQEAYSWKHGIVTMGASLESETTAATLGKTGVRTFNPMSNIDFLSIPIGRYIDINLKFGERLDKKPCIFSVNYFLKDDSGNFLNTKLDKMIWLKWMELRVNGEAGVIDIGTGMIPKYEDLGALFKKYLNRDYSRQDYTVQFTLRVRQNVEKIERITKIYKDMGSKVPQELFTELSAQKERLLVLLKEKGEYISPFDFNGS
ncbi:MAG: phosphoenolpyruvate carboxykinase (GTP), partial [Actinobacteria bacterium]|nr:phosphoenolpyruvate carboxykinase (GTP) [Actinomycetota bacterium]